MVATDIYYLYCILHESKFSTESWSMPVYRSHSAVQSEIPTGNPARVDYNTESN